MQFFFKRKETSIAEGHEEIILVDSFNTDLIIATRSQEDGRRLVILNDGHQESRYDKYPVIKGGRIAGEELRKEAGFFQSRILLEADDAELFVNTMKQQ